MKKILVLFLGASLFATTGCKKYLDVNTNPNGPSSADPALYIPSIVSNFALGVQFDARLIGPYTQNFLMTTAAHAYNTHGYVRNSDFGGELWRNVYWKGGLNISDMVSISRNQKRWDIAGAGLVLRAWGWQNLTDYHGEIIVSEAFDPSKNTFKYDSQEYVYEEVVKLSREAIMELEKTGDGVGSAQFTRFDIMYKGDRTKWLKFAYGLLAINAHHLSNKASYQPDSVISYVDKSFTSNADDAIVPFLGVTSADANFFGPLRGNFASYGQSGFIVRLMNGSVFTTTEDPRRRVMLAPSLDGQFRGIEPMTGQSTANANTQTAVRNVWGTALGFTAPTGTLGRYLFQNDAGFPLMTYAMLQFIKAEAAFIKGDRALALQAYKNGLNAHMEFVQTGKSGALKVFTPDAAATSTIYATERAAYMANPNVVPTNPANLTHNMILLQKYIALWGYGFIETWSDLRKYEYSDTKFNTFTLPTTFFADNNGKPAYRVRPRYNSEYIWNIDALQAIGGFDQDFHTKKLWFHQP